MTEQVYQYDSVQMTVRVVADCYEWTIRKICEHFLIQDFIFHSDILQDSSCEVRSFYN